MNFVLSKSKLWQHAHTLGTQALGQGKKWSPGPNSSVSRTRVLFFPHCCQCYISISKLVESDDDGDNDGMSPSPGHRHICKTYVQEA